MGWSSPARRRRKAIKDSLAHNLNSLAETLASHEEAGSVSEPHVNQALQALARSGLQNKKFFDRPESKMALGAVCMSFAFSCPDAIAVLFPPVQAQSIAAGLFVGSFLFGGLLWFYGLQESKLPEPPPERFSIRWWFNRVALPLIGITALVVIVYIASQKLTGCCGSPEIAPLLPLDSTAT